MNAHSAILGGSNAARLLACPASYHEALKAPVSDVESPYAAEGTLLHGGTAEAVRRRLSPDMVRHRWATLADDFSDVQLDIIAKALEALEELKKRYPGGKNWRVVGLEVSMPMPGVTGAFGSADLVVANNVAVIVVDWKFGSGVPVYALYDMPDGSQQLNAQAAFYACCARHRYRRAFKDHQIVLAIIQPRLDPACTFAETDNDELDGFVVAFREAVLEAMGRSAHRERGEHCRFAVCKSTCPLWTGPVFELAILDPAKAALQAAADEEPTEYGAFLSRALTLSEIAEAWAAEIRRQAHVFLQDGGAIREWKLVPKRGTRQWLGSEGETADALLHLGAAMPDIYTEPELRSVAQVEKALAKRKLQLPPELHAMVSSGTTIARVEDKRPESSHGQVVTDLRQALKAL
jgi:hypothetical protein